MSLPVVACRIQQLQGCFATAIDVYKYAGLYRGVFPVKCNHDRELLKEMIVGGSPHGFGGLEVSLMAFRAGSSHHALLQLTFVHEVCCHHAHASLSQASVFFNP